MSFQKNYRKGKRLSYLENPDLLEKCVEEVSGKLLKNPQIKKIFTASCKTTKYCLCLYLFCFILKEKQKSPQLHQTQNICT